MEICYKGLEINTEGDKQISLRGKIAQHTKHDLASTTHATTTSRAWHALLPLNMQRMQVLSEDNLGHVLSVSALPALLQQEQAPTKLSAIFWASCSPKLLRKAVQGLQQEILLSCLPSPRKWPVL